MSTGMTIEQVRAEFDLHRLDAFYSYTAANPPVHVSVARFLGISQQPKAATPEDSSNQDVEGFLASLM